MHSQRITLFESQMLWSDFWRVLPGPLSAGHESPHSSGQGLECSTSTAKTASTSNPETASVGGRPLLQGSPVHFTVAHMQLKATLLRRDDESGCKGAVFCAAQLDWWHRLTSMRQGQAFEILHCSLVSYIVQLTRCIAEGYIKQDDTRRPLT